MANETVLFKRGDSATITSTPVTDGQILFDTSGNGKMYLDNGTDRLEMGGAITVDASLSKTSTNAIQNKAVTGNILNSLAEVSAATQQNTIAGALALKEVNSSLTNENSETFNFGVKDGVRGFFTNPSRADDSFIPFNNNISEIYYSKNNKTNILTDTIAIPKTQNYILLYAGHNNGIAMTVKLNEKEITPIISALPFNLPMFVYIFQAKSGDELYYYCNNSGGNSYNYVYLLN